MSAARRMHGSRGGRAGRGKRRRGAACGDKRDFLFSGLAPPARRRVRVDEVALFSCTEWETADEIAHVMRCSARGARFVIDAMACVGGNTLGFLRSAKFEGVFAIESDATRFEMLRSNVDLVRTAERKAGEAGGPGKSKEVRCELLQGDCMKLICEGGVAGVALGECAVFMDPPWGGPSVMEGHARIRLSVNGEDVSEACSRLAEAGVRIIFLKAPLRFALEEFRRNVHRFTSGRWCVTEARELRKMQLLTVAPSLEEPKLLASPASPLFCS